MSVQENMYPPAFTNKIENIFYRLRHLNELFQHKNFQTRNGQIPWNKSSIPKRRPELLLEGPQNAYK